MLDITRLNLAGDILAIGDMIIAGWAALIIFCGMMLLLPHTSWYDVDDDVRRAVYVVVDIATGTLTSIVILVAVTVRPPAALWHGCVVTTLILTALACLGVAAPGRVRRVGAHAALGLLVVVAALSIGYNSARIDEAPRLAGTLEEAYGIEDVRYDTPEGVNPTAPQFNQTGVRYVDADWRVPAGHTPVPGLKASGKTRAMHGTLVIDDVNHVHLAVGLTPLVIARGDGPTWRASITS